MLSHNYEDLDHWFQRLNAPLKHLPVQERVQLHAEVRQHLEALAAANEELGSTPEKAWEHALTQFGDPGKFGRRMAWEWRRGRGWVSPDMAAVLCGVGVHAAASIGVVVLFCLICLLDRFGFGITESGAGLGMDIGYFVGVPIITGMTLGRKYPDRALTGAFHAALVMPILLFLTAVFASPLPHPATMTEVGTDIAQIIGIGVDLVLLTCGAAYLASARVRREWYRPALTNFKLALPRLTRQQIL